MDSDSATCSQRVALYSHDAMGLGHLRRNLAIAQSLVDASPTTTVLILAGAREAGSLALPPRTDCVTLPALGKAVGGDYHARDLGVSLARLVRMRAHAIHSVLDTFAPDVLIVDKKPLGAFREVEPALRSLRRKGRTRTILGLRDVLDEPSVVDREWRSIGGNEVVRELYDAVWIYGSPSIYDALHEYGLQEPLGDLAHFTGYLGRKAPSAAQTSALRARLALPEGRIALGLVGGGQDGWPLAQAFADASFPSDMTGVLVTGPFMPADAKTRLAALAGGRPDLRVHEFVGDADVLLHCADRVVTMGGYNSVCEALGARKRVLIVPRVHPRREQWIRAERLRELGLVDVLAPNRLDSGALSRWISDDRAAPDFSSLDLGGLARIPALLADLLAKEPLAAAAEGWEATA